MLWREIGYVCEVQVLACYNLCAPEKKFQPSRLVLAVARGGKEPCG